MVVSGPQIPGKYAMPEVQPCAVGTDSIARGVSRNTTESSVAGFELSRGSAVRTSL